MDGFIKKLLSTQFMKFCITGGLGLITDAGIFHLIKVSFGVENWLLLNIIPIFGYSAAVVQNYIVNHFWTFRSQTVDLEISKDAFLKFLSVSLISLVPRYIVYNLVLGAFTSSGGFVPDIANLAGIIAGTLVNFLGSKFIVFRSR
ncbi:MAG TPA: GtrA family protein [bacterium]|jgi:putative flippase GtrA|nr:GtrA family protein [bacterium]